MNFFGTASCLKFGDSDLDFKSQAQEPLWDPALVRYSPGCKSPVSECPYPKQNKKRVSVPTTQGVKYQTYYDNSTSEMY